MDGPPQLHASLLTARALGCERDGRVLFKGLDLDIRPGDVIELTGPNGSGKTTLLRCIAGLTGDFDGEVSHDRAVQLRRPSWRIESATDAAAELARGLRRSKGPMHRTNHCHRCSTVSDSPVTSSRRVSSCRPVSSVARRLRGSASSNAALWLLDEPLTALDDAGMCAGARASRAASRPAGGAALCATHQSSGSRADVAACTRTCRVTSRHSPARRPPAARSRRRCNATSRSRSVRAAN